MPEWLRDLWSPLAVFLPLLVGLFGWIIRVGLASKSDLAKVLDALSQEQIDRRAAIHHVTNRLDRGEARFEALGEQIKQLPTIADVHALAVAIERVTAPIAVSNAQIQGLQDRIVATGERIALIEDFLREGRR